MDSINPLRSIVQPQVCMTGKKTSTRGLPGKMIRIHSCYTNTHLRPDTGCLYVKAVLPVSRRSMSFFISINIPMEEKGTRWNCPMSDCDPSRYLLGRSRHIRFFGSCALRVAPRSSIGGRAGFLGGGRDDSPSLSLPNRDVHMVLFPVKANLDSG